MSADPDLGPEAKKLLERVKNDLSYHTPPSNEAKMNMHVIRSATFALAEIFIRRAPMGRDLSLALTHLEEAQRAVIGACAKEWPVSEPI